MCEPVAAGIDGSECANRALDWAAGEAARRRRPLKLVHVVDPWPRRVPMFAPPEAVERMAIIGHRVLDVAAERVHRRHPDLQTTTRLVAERTSDALRQEAEHAFELVLGNRGYGGFTGLLLGSTGLRMAARTPVPLIIVRGDTAERGDVVVGLDPAKDEETTLRYAFDAAVLHRTGLRVVHAWSPCPPYEGFAPEKGAIEADVRKRVAAVVDRSRPTSPRIDVVEEVVDDHPVSALISASRGARLLVTGVHERDWTAPRLGSVGHGAVHHAHCPVAVVPRSGARRQSVRDHPEEA
ncbi:universal stress protein [Actinomadura sp. WMMB 499]|uniref:universal stress protein n=1 Tax=Actinomadura sp. WMMB 499 TaxID=1219491 RepID=UPI001243F973|nr:universal stress protein [Actinomadura sp. WMMB 499]QFG21268.1 universal stress protein [Actinomadura sp. WMMB 499]